MAAQDYAKLHAMEAETRHNTMQLLYMAIDYVEEHELSVHVASGSAQVVSLILNDTGADSCVQALDYTAKLLHVCEQSLLADLEYIPVKNMFIVVEKNLRDLVAMRLQSTLPFGDRESFEEAMSAAFGSRINSGKEIYSKVMQSYKKVINANFESAFSSKADIRGGAKKRQKKQKRK